MTSGGFLSVASVVVILACVAVLAVLSALALAPLDGPAHRRRFVAFTVFLVGAWALAVLLVALTRRTI